MKVIHHGVSLKVTDSSSKHVPSSSLGIEHLGPEAKKHYDAHRKGILKAHPKLRTATNKMQRKEILKANPKMHADVKKRNADTLNKVAKSLHKHLSTTHPKELVHHIRKVLHAHETPMQKQGHNHIKHTTYETSSGTKHHTSNPGADYEHILKKPHEIEVHHSGTSVVFKHKGKTFARHSIKFDSQSDPLSSLKSAGHPA